MPKRGESTATSAQTAPTADKAKATKVVEKFPATEKFKKFLEKAEKGLSKKLFETREVEAGKTGEIKNKIVFASFAPTPKGDGHEELSREDDEFNVEQIKRVLWHYHTMEYAEQTGSVIILQILQPASDDPDGFHLLSFQEFKEN